MKAISNLIQKSFTACLLFQLGTGLAIGQNENRNDFPPADTTAVPADAPSGNTAAGNRGEGRRVIYDRGGASIGQYDPSGNSLPAEVSRYEYMGTSRPAAKSTQVAEKRSKSGYRDSGRSSIGQPDPSSNSPAPADGVVKTNDPYFSNSPAKDQGQGGVVPAADSTSTTDVSAWGNTAEPAGNGSTQPGASRNTEKKSSGQKKQE
jgi:hypothetical protein